MTEFIHTPFSHLTDIELVRLADTSADDFARELASRLESALEELGTYIDDDEDSD